jgi:hypothetical protein
MRPYLKKLHHKKKGSGRVAQGEGPEFKLPVLQKKKKRKEKENKTMRIVFNSITLQQRKAAVSTFIFGLK